MRRLPVALAALFALLVPALSAASGRGDGERPRLWEVSITAGFNSDGYEMDFAGGCFPVEWFGAKISLGWADRLTAEDVSDLLFPNWDTDDYYGDYDYDHDVRFRFMPSVELRSPRIKLQGGAWGVRAFVNPGMMLSTNGGGGRHAQWHNWFVRTGVMADFGDFYLQLAYGYSDFYLYSGVEVKMDHMGRRVKDSPTHSGLVTIGFRFY